MMKTLVEDEKRREVVGIHSISHMTFRANGEVELS
jgi:hypothetical protein